MSSESEPSAEVEQSTAEAPIVETVSAAPPLAFSPQAQAAMQHAREREGLAVVFKVHPAPIHDPIRYYLDGRPISPTEADRLQMEQGIEAAWWYPEEWDALPGADAG